MIGRQHFPRIFSSVLLMAIAWLSVVVAAPTAIANQQAGATVLIINSAIGPGVADYITRGIEQANTEKARVVILQIDTPGGLSKSMRVIIKAILASKIPVLGFVAPSGARAASAGAFILYATNLAAMAPGTNLGAATPVNLIGKNKKDDKQTATSKQPAASQRKALNDARAYIRSLAQLRGRNAKWAEQAVIRGASLSAKEALERNVINFIAKDIPTLLQQVNNRTVTVAGQSVKLATKNIAIAYLKQDWRSRFLTIITDPSVAYLLLMIGFYGLLFEFMNPGAIVPGVAGAICFVLALYAFQLLPISFAGLGLIILGLAFLVAEAFLPSFGVLGLGGIASFVAGSIMLIDTQHMGFGIPLKLIIIVAVVTVLFLLFVFQLAFRSQRRQVVSGQEAMQGKVGIIQKVNSDVWVKIEGELWRVKCGEAFAENQKVKVIKVEGLTLRVEPVKDSR